MDNFEAVKPVPKGHTPKSSRTRHLDESLNDYFNVIHKQPESRQITPILPEASFGLWVLSLPVSVCVSVCLCVNRLFMR